VIVGSAEVIPFEAGTQSGRGRSRCRATTADGRPCRNYAVGPNGYCRIHGGGRPADARAARAAHPTAQTRANDSSAVRDWLSRRLAGSYPIDDFGLDEELFRDVLVPLFRPLYRKYFRVQAIGLDNVPPEGPALLVANHSGTIALDAVMMQHAVAAEHPARRIVRNIAGDLIFRLPFLGPIARKSGNAVARDEDALELLRRGELVGVFPEGYKGVGKGWAERYRLQRFGRGGFIQLALRARVPIVPVAIVGAEEAYPMIANLSSLAGLLRLPYFPVTPTWPLLGPLGLLPLPSRWIIEFGLPLQTSDQPKDAHEDPMLVFELTDTIRDRIQQMLHANLGARRGVFF
jgi:1-acyl-sn-glycerol-3-phosphate acyltransferase